MPRLLDPVTLTGTHVQLEPLSSGHAAGLAAAGAIDRSTYTLTHVPDGVDATTIYIEQLLRDHASGLVLPFVQISQATGEPVGCTRYLDPHWWRGRDEPDEIEIGGTWLAAPAQRTAINTEAKHLLLRHAFETWGVWRVAICTDARNQQSRAAIARIGATFEGLLRNHRLAADSPTLAPRDTAVYSITADEWPEIAAALRDRLGSQ